MASESSNIDYSQIPLSKPPPGQVTNFVDPVSISWAGRLAIYLTLPIMAIAFFLRAHIRLKKRQVGVDDYLLVLGAGGSASFCGVLLPVLLKDVWGRHSWDIPISSIAPWFFQYSVIAGCLYNISAMFTKVSILAFYLRIFFPSDLARVFIWCGMVFIGLGYLALTGAMLGYMLPHRGDGGWGSTAELTRMGNPSRIIDFAQGVFSLVSDFYVITIPITIVFRLNLPKNRKIGVGCIFLVGFVSLGCCIVGTVLRYHAMVYTVEDNRWLSVKFQALCVAELNVGIFCACVPVFFVVLRTWMHRAESGFIYLKQRLASRASEETDLGGDSGVYHHDHQETGIKLDIPTGTLSGLKSFFRKAGKDKKQRTEETETDMTLYLELQSIDYEYHAQIRCGSRTNK